MGMRCRWKLLIVKARASMGTQYHSHFQAFFLAAYACGSLRSHAFNQCGAVLSCVQPCIVHLLPVVHLGVLCLISGQHMIAVSFAVAMAL